MNFPALVNEIVIFESQKDFRWLNGLDDEKWKLLTTLGEQQKKSKLNHVPFMLQLIKKHPEIIELKVDLLEYYQMNADIESEELLINSMLKSNPESFYAKIELASLYCKQDKIDKAKAVLGGGTMDMINFMPGRKEYMKLEFLQFHSLAIKCHVAANEQSHAIHKLKLMILVDKNHKSTKALLKHVQRTVKHNLNLN